MFFFSVRMYIAVFNKFELNVYYFMMHLIVEKIQCNSVIHFTCMDNALNLINEFNVQKFLKFIENKTFQTFDAKIAHT